MRKLIAHCFLLLTITSYLLPITYASDSTPSADVKSKLEELKKEIASKAAQLKQFVDKKLKDKAYIGKVKTKSSSSVTLATKNGPKIVNINQDTQFDSQIKGKKYQQKSILEEDYLTALGDVDETEVLTAKKIFLLPTPNSELKTYLWGQVVAISDKLVTIKDRNLKNIAVSVSATSDIKVSNFIILTGILGKNDIFEAQFVYVIPQGGIIKPARPAGGPKKVATPSAKPTSR